MPSTADDDEPRGRSLFRREVRDFTRYEIFIFNGETGLFAMVSLSFVFEGSGAISGAICDHSGINLQR